MDQDRITELINKSEITSIVNSYFRALDEKNFDAQQFASIFTPQAKVTRPNGASLIGPEEISASHEKSFSRFEGSQHFVAGHDISLDGSTANVRANLIAMHMWQGSKTDANKLDNFFIAGGVMHATLMQSDGQWRISQMSNAVLWRAGGFKDMMQTGTVTKEAQSLNVSHPNEPVLTSLDSVERLMVYAKNQIPSQINSSRLASDSQTAGGRQQQASLARDEHG